MFRARLGLCAAAAITAAALVAPTSAASAASVPLPDSMAAAGDSITQAFDIDLSGLFQSSPQYSWATGTSTAVDSEYQRILAANPAIKGHEYNYAVPGDTMADVDGQVKTAAAKGVQYLTIEAGADDVCASSISQMTPTATFQSEFHKALTDFTAADPDAHIFVASIPNIYEVWEDEHTNILAEIMWNLLPLCNTMLDITTTSAQRQQILAQEQAYNKVLGAVCAEFTQCKFDNDAVYDYNFTSADISSVDYFHPSILGQNELASLAWAAGYWPGTP